MSLSRRALFRTLGGLNGRANAGTFINARGWEALQAELRYTAELQMLNPPAADEIRISSNENPNGPGTHVLESMLGQLDQVGRYVFNARIGSGEITEQLANVSGIGGDGIMLGAGSGELLVAATRAFTSPTKALVTGEPSYGQPLETAAAIGTPIKKIPVDADLRLDLDAMADAATGAGLVFFCNPNNPTATAHGADAVANFVDRVHAASPDTYFLLDEAYYDYATDPAFATAFPLAKDHPRVIVARTFSKAYGMAGLRLGYAAGQKATIDLMRPYTMGAFGANDLVVAGAWTSTQNPDHIRMERERNARVRQSTIDFFTQNDFQVTDSQTNFIFVKVNRTAQAFRDACREQNVFVGRDFPPLNNEWARISIGTEDEMNRAVEVFAQVLGVSAPMSAARG